MSNDRPNKDLSPLDSSLMDSLLEQTLHPESDQDERRMRELMTVIRRERDVVVERVSLKKRRLGWFPLSMAAAALVVFAFLISSSSSQQSALAAVNRVLVAEERSGIREYKITVDVRDRSGAQRSRSHTLFVRNRAFVIEVSPRFGNGTIWIGGDEDHRWLVPRFGPVFVGNEAFLRSRYPDRMHVDTPILSVTTILKRLKSSYKLSLESNVDLEHDGSTIVSDHISATLSGNVKKRLADRVDVWADAVTGDVCRLELSRNGVDNVGWLIATAQLVGTPDVSLGFFDHQSHHDPARKIERLDSAVGNIGSPKRD